MSRAAGPGRRLAGDPRVDEQPIARGTESGPVGSDGLRGLREALALTHSTHLEAIYRADGHASKDTRPEAKASADSKVSSVATLSQV